MNLLDSFKDYLFSQSDKPEKVTVKNYLSDISHFVRWYENTFAKSFDPKEVSSLTLNDYRNGCSKVFSSSSLDRHFSTLRKFFQFLLIDGKISLNPFTVKNLQLEPQRDPWHIKDFKDFLYVYNASKLTIKNYLIDIKQFLAWTQEVTSSANVLPEINTKLVEEYKQRLLSQGSFSPATINRKLSSLRKYLAWAQSQGLVRSQTEIPNQLNNPPAGEAGEVIQQSVDSQPKVRSHSAFPPIRLFQRTSNAFILALDSSLIIHLARLVDRVEYALWKSKGHPIFAEARKLKLDAKKLTSNFQILSSASSVQRPASVKNLPKEFYAPLEISTKYFPWYKKAWITARYSRPKWYKTYHSYPIAHYLNFAVLIIFLMIISFSFYNAFFQKGNQSPTLAVGLPTAPPRVLSFQGRLTNNQDTPISTPSALRFAIYNNATATDSGDLSVMLWQEVDNVAPDQDGIFNVLLGNNTTIPSTLFTQNNALWLGVTVGTTDELAPRQPLATVAYATNAETLQGLLPITAAGATQSNVVLALDSSGNLTIGGAATPTFQATGGQFTLSGQGLLLTTNAGSNSNITVSPDGLGQIDLQKPLVNTTNNNNITTATGAVEVDDLLAVLATSSGQSALTINQDSTGPLISASTSGVEKFTVDASGNLKTAGTTTFGGKTYTWPGSIDANNYVLRAQTDGTLAWVPATSVGNNFWQELAGALSPVNSGDDFLLGSSSTSSAAFSFTGLKGNQTQASMSGNLIVMANNGYGGNVGIGTTSPLAMLSVGPTSQFQVNSSGAIAAATGLSSSGTITFSGFTGANDGGVIYANSSGMLSQTAAGTGTECLTGGTTPQWTSCSSAANNYWQRVAGNLSPLNTDDTLSATSAADTVATFTTDNPAGTLTNNTLIQQTGAGTVTNLLNLTQSAGAVTNGINLTGTFTNLINSPTLVVTNAGAASGLTGLVSTGTVTLGGAAGTETLTLGQSTEGQTINIGGAQVADTKTQTIHLGDSATATGKDVITIGNTNAASSLALSAGTGGLTLSNTATAGTIFNTATATDDQLALLPKTGGAARYTGTITSTDLTAAHTWTFPNADGTVAVSASTPIGLDASGNISCPTCLASGGTLWTAGATSGTTTQTVAQGGTLTFTAGTGVTTTGSAGVITFAIGQAVGSGDSPTFTGLTLAGTVSINNNASTNTTNIGTGSTSGAVAIGGGSDTLAIDTTNWDVSSSGVASGLTGLSSSGTITFSGFSGANNGGVIYANSSGTLSQTAAGTSTQCLIGGTSAPAWSSCSSAASNYWQRVVGNLSPLTTNDTLSATSAADTVATFTINNPAGTLTNNTLIQQTGAGTVTNLLNLTQSAGAVTNGINLTGTFTKLINSTNFNVTNAGAVTAVGINSGSGLLQGTGGLTLTGATSINNNASTNTTNIGTGSTSGAIAIGGGSDTLAISTTNWGITSLGVASGLTGLSSSGTITLSGLTNSQAVFTNGSDQLVSNAITGSGNVVMSTSPVLSTSLTTDSSSFDLLNTTATTVNFAGGATTLLSMGAPTGSASTSATLTLGGASGTIRPATGALNLQYKSGGNAWTTGLTILDNTGSVGIGTTAPVARLDLRGNSAVTPVASISGNTNFAAFLVDNQGSGDLITASSSAHGTNTARTEFKVTSSGGEYARTWYDLDNSAYYMDLASAGYSLLAAGSVGIGTTTPGFQTTLYGTAQTTSAIADAGSKGGTLLLGGADVGVGSGGTLLFGVEGGGNNTPNNFFAAIKGLNTNGSSYTTGDLAFSTRNALGDTALTERMRILAGGNVGIGTTGPNTPLSVAGTVTVDFNQANTGTAANFLQFGSGSGEGIGSKRNAGGQQYALDFYTGSAERMTILNGGNVGIGNTGPGYKLDVTGDVNASVYLRAGGMAMNAIPITYGTFGLASAQNGYYGILFGQATSNAEIMYDGSGNGGIYYQNWGWQTYTTVSNHYLGIGVTAPQTTLEVGGDLTVSYPSDPTNYNLDIHPYSSGVNAVNWSFNTKTVAGGTKTPLMVSWNGTVYVNLPSAGTRLVCKDSAGTGQKYLLTCGSGYTTGDIAEDIIAPTAEAGDVVVIDPNGPNQDNVPTTRKATYGTAISKPYDQNILGVISTAGFVYNETNLGPDSRPLSTSGVVALKVTTINGAIHKGDPITTSAIPGAGMLATKAGPIVGKAEEDWNGSTATQSAQLVNGAWKAVNSTCQAGQANCYNEGKLMALLAVSWSDPQVYLTSTGDLNLVDQTASADANFTVPHYFTLNDALGDPVDRVGAFSDAVIANLRAGSINAQQITANALNVATENVTISGQSLHDYIASVVQGILNNGTIQQFNNQGVISPIASVNELHTNFISPVGSDVNIGIKLDNNKLSILNGNTASSSAVATIDNQGNATFSGQLSAASGQFGDATISGTLHAGKILASDIVGLASPSATYVTNNVMNIYNSTGSASNSNFGLVAGQTTPGTPSGAIGQQLAAGGYLDISSYSGQLTYVENLAVLGQTSLSDTSIVGQLSVGGNFILADDSINVLGSDLSLQPLRQGGLSVMGGLFYIDTNGNVKVGGNADFAKDVTVHGTLATNVISPLPGNDLSLNTGDSNLKVMNASNAAVLSVNSLGDLVASGAGTFNKLNLSLVQPALAVSPTEVVATGSAGTANIVPYQTQVTIDNPSVTDKSLIYITPTSSTNNQVLYLLKQVPGTSFTVGLQNQSFTPIPFNWIIVN